MTLTDEKIDLGGGLITHTLPRVNLLPPEITEKRNVTKARNIALVAVCCAVLCAGATVVISSNDAQKAQEELAAVQQQTRTTTQAIGSLAAVPAFVKSVETARSARAKAMQNDILWHAFLNDLAAAANDSVWLKSLSMTIAQSSSPDPLAPSGVGSISVSGEALQHEKVADWLDKLNNTAPFTYPVFSQSTRKTAGDKPIVAFNSTATIVSDALSRRYEGKPAQ